MGKRSKLLIDQSDNKEGNNAVGLVNIQKIIKEQTLNISDEQIGMLANKLANLLKDTGSTENLDNRRGIDFFSENNWNVYEYFWLSKNMKDNILLILSDKIVAETNATSINIKDFALRKIDPYMCKSVNRIFYLSKIKVGKTYSDVYLIPSDVKDLKLYFPGITEIPQKIDIEQLGKMVNTAGTEG